MRLRRKILIAVAGVILITPTVLLYFVASTERGLAFVAGRLGQVLGPPG